MDGVVGDDNALGRAHHGEGEAVAVAGGEDLTVMTKGQSCTPRGGQHDLGRVGHGRLYWDRTGG